MADSPPNKKANTAAIKCVSPLLWLKIPTPIKPRAVNVSRIVNILMLKARCRKYVPMIMSNPRRKTDTLKTIVDIGYGPIPK